MEYRRGNPSVWPCRVWRERRSEEEGVENGIPKGDSDLGSGCVAL